MIDIFKRFKKNSNIAKNKQQVLLDFVNDTENIKKAAEGSMEKRVELIDRVLKKHPA